MKRNSVLKIAGLFGAVAIWAGAGTSAFASIEFVGSSGSLSAKAVFDIVGGNLQVTLYNTYNGDTVNQASVLTALFFSGANGLTPVSAAAPSGSLLWVAENSSAPPGSSTLGTEWELPERFIGGPRRG